MSTGHEDWEAPAKSARVATLVLLFKGVETRIPATQPCTVVQMHCETHQLLCRAARQSIPGRQPRRKGVWKMKRR